MRILVDTNILLRMSDKLSPQRPACLHAIQHLKNRQHELCLCAQTMIEFWVVSTRPREVNGLGLGASDALFDLSAFEQNFMLLPEPDDIAYRWRQIVSQHSVLGRQAHDARLVALMLAHGVSHLMTLNSTDFDRYKQIATTDPHSALSL
jgi:predicted nucleic acid-binding protein